MESEVQYLIRKAKMKKAELERARLKAEADAKKAEEDRKKAERKAKKKKAKEANGTAAGEETEEKVEEAEAPTAAPPAGEAGILGLFAVHRRWAGFNLKSLKRDFKCTLILNTSCLPLPGTDFNTENFEDEL